MKNEKQKNEKKKENEKKKKKLKKDAEEAAEEPGKKEKAAEDEGKEQNRLTKRSYYVSRVVLEIQAQNAKETNLKRVQLAVKTNRDKEARNATWRKKEQRQKDFPGFYAGFKVFTEKRKDLPPKCEE